MTAQREPADREFPVLTAAVCAICVLIYIAMNTPMGQTVEGARKFGEYTELAIFKGAYWGIVTSAFVHRDTLHLLFNLYWFWILGGIFERRFGIPLLAAFFLFSAIVSSGAELATGHSGIGLSGVGYALFGFAWIARARVPELARALPNQMVTLWLGWGALCVVMTQLGYMNVANLAHLGGLVFGVLVGRMYVSEDYRAILGAGLAALFLVTIVPLFWNPLSADWFAVQADKAFHRRDLAASEYNIKRALALGQDRVWAWSHLAEIYGAEGRQVEYAEALRNLRSLDSDLADRIASQFGEPE